MAKFKFVEPDDISADSLKVLGLMGLNPTFASKWVTLLVFFNIIWFCFFVILAVKGILVSYNTDLFYTSECIQTCILGIHSLAHILVFHGKRKAVLSLVEKKSKFWKITDVADHALFTKCVNVLNIAKTFIRTYFISTILAGFFFNLQIVTTGTLPSGCYIPKGWFSFLAVGMMYMTVVIILIISGADCFFCSLGSGLIVQFNLLAFKLRNLSFSPNKSEKHMWEDLRTLVNYHNFLLSYCSELNAVFSGLFLLLFGICILASSVSVFIFMQPGDLSYRIKFMLYFLTLIIETGFYCVPLEIAIHAAQQLDNAVYESKWYELRTQKFKKSLAMIMRKAQQPINFTGYGLVTMNLQSYVLICKTVFSFYTYLNSMQKLSSK